ncbi:MAG: S-layer homology domain-containing protein [Oscillibacter sp.]|nr:S-layer homology domain-containing protein [Oscillibacter sp.]
MKRILIKLARRTIPLAFLCAFLCVSAAALENPFSDVRRDAPYYDAVMWVLETGVTAGTSSTAFSPAATCNRGQVVTFLWRMAGQPEAASDYNPFSDVGRSSFCYKAVLWAVQQEITNGTTDDTFSPGNLCTYAMC